MGLAVDAFGDLPQASGAVIDGIHGGHHGQEHLGGADVAGGLVAADVLLPGLQSQAQGRPALSILRDPHQAPRQQPFVGLASGKVGGMGAAVAQGHPKALGGSHHDVRPPFSRRLQESQAEQVGSYGHHHPPLVGPLHQLAVIPDLSIGVGILQEQSKAVLQLQLRRIGHTHLDPQGLCPRLHDGNGLGMAAAIHPKNWGLLAR